jgi:hypothetical protein
VPENDDRKLEQMFERYASRSWNGVRVDDLETYRRLVELALELERMGTTSWSVESGKSLMMAATVARRLASKVYRRTLAHWDRRNGARD